MDDVTDRTARFNLDSFWVLRARVAPQPRTAEVTADVPDESVSALSRDWHEPTVRFGAVRWFAR